MGNQPGSPVEGAVDRRMPGPVLAVPLILLAASASAFPGLEVRDMTGDEFGHLGQNVLQMLDRSIEANRPDQFSAHMPLAWIVRHLFHGLLGDENLAIWRLHSALGCCLGALLSWWAVWRCRAPVRALAVGLLVAVNPILSFHAHDSTNYALTPLCGAILLAGLSDLGAARGSSRWVLVLGLLLGTANDYFFAFLSLSAFLMTPLLVRWSADPRRARALAMQVWGLVAVLVALPVFVFVKRLVEVPFSQLVYRHANAALEPMTVWQTVQVGLTDFAVSYVEGYGAGIRHQVDPWVAVGPLVLLLCSLAVSLRSRDHLVRSAGWLVALSVTIILITDYVFGQVVWDAAGEDGPTTRDFPSFPRTFIGLLPALAVIWVDCLLRNGRRIGMALVVGLFLLQALDTGRQVSAVSDTRSWAADRIEELWRPGDLVMSCLNIAHRLRDDIPLVAERRLCLPDTAEPPARILMVTFPGGWEADRVGLCWNQGFSLLDNGYRVRLSEDRFLPPHDEGTNSFLESGIRLIVLERSEPDPQGPDIVPWHLEFEPSLLGGTRGASVTATWFTNGDAEDETHPFASRVRLARQTDQLHDFSLIIHPKKPPAWLVKSTFGLLRPFDEPLALWPNMPLPPDPIIPSIKLRTYSVQEPALRVLGRLLNALMGLGALTGALASLRRRKEDAEVNP